MTWANLVLFIHIIAACIWIGGQITLASLIPLLRHDRTLVHAAAQRFGKLAWSAYAVLVITGIINVHNIGLSWGSLMSSSEGRLLVDKLGLVFISGAAAAIHSFIQGPRQREQMSKRAMAAWSGVLGSASLLSALGAALYGVVLR